MPSAYRVEEAERKLRGMGDRSVSGSPEQVEEGLG
jgi:hypothetical protein